MATLGARLLLRGLASGGSRRFYSTRHTSLLNRTIHRSQQLLHSHSRWQVSVSHWSRAYSSSSGKENDGEGKGEEEEEGGSESEQEGSESEENLGLEMLPVSRHHAIAPINIPDDFPDVPVLPITRNPVFPRFVKMLEVSGGIMVRKEGGAKMREL